MMMSECQISKFFDQMKEELINKMTLCEDI